MKRTSTETQIAKFIRLIDAQIRVMPAEPARIDINPDDEALMFDVWDELQARHHADRNALLESAIVNEVCRMLSSDTNTPPSIEIGSPSAWDYAVFDVFGRDDLRAVFFGPDYCRPSPSHFEPLRAKAPTQKQIAAHVFRIQKRYGPAYHVVEDIVHIGARVWGRAEWMRQACVALWPSEVVQALGVGKRAVDFRKQDLLARKEEERRQARVRSGKKHNRPPGKWNGLTLKQLIEKFIGDSLEQKHISGCRGEIIANKLAEEWGGIWKSGTIEKALSREFKRQRKVK